MHPCSFARLSDAVLLRDYAAHRAHRCRDIATELVYLGEIDARKLWRSAAYPTLHEYCVHELHFSDDSAYKHVRAASAAREFPALLDAVAEGRLHLSAVVMLAPRLTAENVESLIAAATHRTKGEIERLLAERFPRPDLPERMAALNISSTTVQEMHDVFAPGPIESAAPVPEAPRPRVTPLSPQRFGYQFTGDQSFHDDLARFRALMGHRVGASGVVETLHHALRLGIRQLEKRKYGATDRPRARRSRPGTNPRHIPAEVRRAVWERDGGRCTFVSDSGRRCEARDRLEFDHIEPVARGGLATVSNLRLRCRAHNQLEAERAYGAEFMKHKREAAVERARADAERTRAAEEARERTLAAEEVVPWLRALGLRADESRQAAALCERIPNAPLEQRVRLALTCFAKPGRSRGAGVPSPTAGSPLAPRLRPVHGCGRDLAPSP